MEILLATSLLGIITTSLLYIWLAPEERTFVAATGWLELIPPATGEVTYLRPNPEEAPNVARAA